MGVDSTLTHGVRGLPGGSSLRKLLLAHGIRPWYDKRSRLTEQSIIRWVRAHIERTGTWPSRSDGDVPEAPGENWESVNLALVHGRRGLPGGSSLRKLCLAHGLQPQSGRGTPLTEEKIMRWMRVHFQRTGRWPGSADGDVDEAPGENWSALDAALANGMRGLPGGSSLPKLLLAHGVRRWRKGRPGLTEQTILRWERAHFQRTGKWPRPTSGIIAGAPDENWKSVDISLTLGHRGLPGGSSLRKLLLAHGIKPLYDGRPRLTVKQIRGWGAAYLQKHGHTPHVDSGAIPKTGGWNWRAVNSALRNGSHGLPGGSSLAILFARRGKKRRPKR
jgi:hypothetical protein